MSSFCLIAGPEAEKWSTTENTNVLLDAMKLRGSNVRSVTKRSNLLILATAYEWERELNSISRLIAEHGHWIVAADSTVFYKSDLLRRLRSHDHEPQSESPADLIACTLDAFGEDGISFIEGEFAFSAWNQNSHTLISARDPFGTRPAFHASVGETIVIASEPGPISLVTGNTDFDRNDLIRALTMYHGQGFSSPLSGTEELPAGWLARWPKGKTTPHRSRWWRPSRNPEIEKLSIRESAEMAFSLLADSSLERTPRGGAAAAMSGGRDSTTIVGAIENSRRNGREAGELFVISLAYPENDPGNEDEYVTSVAKHLGLNVSWLDTNTVSVFHHNVFNAHTRFRPYAQPFEGQNRAIASMAREAGKRVILNGNGGDNIFAVLDTWMADLLRGLRIPSLYREIQSKTKSNLSYQLSFLKNHVVRPALPYSLYGLAESLLGRRIMSRPWERYVSPYLAPGIFEKSGIIEKDRSDFHSDIVQHYTSVADRYRFWSVAFAGFTRNCASLNHLSLQEGVEIRMPFFDTRVFDFVWSRPPSDFNQGTEHKVLLRMAMEGRLPDSVIAARPKRTGTSDGYFRRKSQSEFSEVRRAVGTSFALADLGIINGSLFNKALDDCVEGSSEFELWLSLTLFAEVWVRSKSGLAPNPV